MAITYTDGCITVEYEEGDPAGGSPANPYTLEDILAADVANGWGVFTEIPSGYYCLSKMLILGTATYFSIQKSLFFETSTVVSTTRIFDCNGANLAIGKSGSSTTYNGIIIEALNYNNVAYQYFRISGPSVIYNTVFKYFRPDIVASNENISSVLTNVIIFGAATIGLGYYCTINNLLCVAGSVFTNNNGFLNVANNIIIDSNSTFYINFAPGVSNYYNIYPESNSLRLLLINGLNKIINLYDCKVNAISASANVAYQESEYTVNNFTTFKIIPSIDCNYTIFDKDGNELDSGSIEGELESSIKYSYWVAYSPPSSASVDINLNDLQPLSIVLSEDGYDDLTIGDINVTLGQPTIIRGDLVETIPPVYYHQQIEGYINPIAISGSIEQVKIEGTLVATKM